MKSIEEIEELESFTSKFYDIFGMIVNRIIHHENLCYFILIFTRNIDLNKNFKILNLIKQREKILTKIITKSANCVLKYSSV